MTDIALLLSWEPGANFLTIYATRPLHTCFGSVVHGTPVHYSWLVLLESRSFLALKLYKVFPGILIVSGRQLSCHIIMDYVQVSGTWSIILAAARDSSLSSQLLCI